MKIAQIVSPILRVPPEKYGGTELIASLLTEELVRLGHDVTLFATADSKTSAKLRSIIKKPIGIGNPDMNPVWAHFAYAFENAQEFDVIHNHGGMYGLIYAPLTKVPLITTLHNIYLEQGDPGFDYFKGNNFVSISRAQRKLIKGLNVVDMVHNSIDIGQFKFQPKKKGYLLWLSNCVANKGPDIAIKVAKELGLKLIMSGKVDSRIPKNHRYFEKEVKPHVDGKNIIYMGEVAADKKAKLFEDAACLLFPIRWEEPFGMVMAEAMASGTPVVAYGRGAVPEVIKDQETGYVVKAGDYGAFVKRVRDVLDGKIDPQACRRHVEKHFIPQVMARNYASVYKALSA
ncbi:MAG: glycosyltransferase family 4 protein [Candidatus Margulisbacteria bacterium]|nr:glycosyltransferase family 4 protein [Candidatus Margulisiibacteriota bacterium]